MKKLTKNFVLGDITAYLGVFVIMTIISVLLTFILRFFIQDKENVVTIISCVLTLLIGSIIISFKIIKANQFDIKNNCNITCIFKEINKNIIPLLILCIIAFITKFLSNGLRVIHFFNNILFYAFNNLIPVNTYVVTIISFVLMCLFIYINSIIIYYVMKRKIKNG